MVSYPGMASRTQPDGQVRLMTKVAHMYHEQGIRQTDIATTLHISQAKVSRLLKRAAETGIVRTIVAVTPGCTPTSSRRSSSASACSRRWSSTSRATNRRSWPVSARPAPRYLENTLTGGERLGISSWSQTLLAVVDRLRPLRVPGAETVVQLVGGMGVPAVQTQANRLLGELAELVGASPRFAPAPLLVGRREIAENLLADPVMGDVARQWRELTMALVGHRQPGAVGAAAAERQRRRPGRPAGPAGPGRGGRRLPPVLLRRRASWSPATSTPASSASPPTRTARSRVGSGVAGGLRKRRAIPAAIKGGWVNVIVTDLATARDLLAGMSTERRAEVPG